MGRFLALDQRQQLLVLALAVMVLFSGGFLGGRQLKGDGESPVLLPNSSNIGVGSDSVAGQGLVIHIKGAVRYPGIYEFPEKSRINDALLKAEALPEADVESVNLAAFLRDEQEIIVPYKEGSDESSQSVSAGKVSINRGTKEELESIPGIGPVMAGNIIGYRKTKTFTRVEDLLNVSGIGEKTLEGLIPYIKL